MEILDLLNEESVSGACSGRASLYINSTRSPTANVSRSLKYDSNFFFVHKHMDTTTDHFTPLALRVRGNSEDNGLQGKRMAY